MRGFAFVVHALLATAVCGQSTEGFIFVPLSGTEVRGASDTRWSTEHVLRNVGSKTVEYIPGGCPLGHCVWARIEPARSVSVPASAKESGFRIRTRGESDDDLLTLSTLLCETSRRSQCVQLPTLRESEFRDRVVIERVPVSSQRRLTLRIDSLKAEGATEVSLSFWSPADNPLGPSIQLPDILLARISTRFERHVRFDDLTAMVPEVGSVDRFRLEVQALDEGDTVWAFISATDNVTQDVSLFTP